MCASRPPAGHRPATAEARPGYYRMRPVAVQAVRFEPGNGAQVAAWCGGEFRQGHGSGFRFMIDIRTAAGTVTAYPGDWIIRGLAGEFYPCRDPVFEHTYEAVTDDA